MKTVFIIVIFAILTAGCAGSASHKIVQTDPVKDQSLTCRQADDEIARAQAIINEVDDDKADVSGADVMDGILFFPFNLIAKNSNYSNALTAANTRIISLKELKQKKGCPDNTAGQVAATDSLTGKLAELDKMQKNGLITDEEYKTLKLKLLGL